MSPRTNHIIPRVLRTNRISQISLNHPSPLHRSNAWTLFILSIHFQNSKLMFIDILKQFTHIHWFPFTLGLNLSSKVVSNRSCINFTYWQVAYDKLFRMNVVYARCTCVGAVSSLQIKTALKQTDCIWVDSLFFNGCIVIEWFCEFFQEKLSASNMFDMLIKIRVYKFNWSI